MRCNRAFGFFFLKLVQIDEKLKTSNPKLLELYEKVCQDVETNNGSTNFVTTIIPLKIDDPSNPKRRIFGIFLTVFINSLILNYYFLAFETVKNPNPDYDTIHSLIYGQHLYSGVGYDL